MDYDQSRSERQIDASLIGRPQSAACFYSRSIPLLPEGGVGSGAALPPSTPVSPEVAAIAYFCDGCAIPWAEPVSLPNAGHRRGRVSFTFACSVDSRAQRA